MSYEEDPEVIADLRLRASSQFDRTRTGEVPWTPPKIHSQVPCRNRCGALVDWTEEAQEAFEVWNRVLARRNESALDQTRIVFCDPCRSKGKPLLAANNRKLVDAVAAAIRELKNGCESHREHELLDKLDKAGHPDVAGLKQWLADKANKGRKVTKGSL